MSQWQLATRLHQFCICAEGSDVGFGRLADMLAASMNVCFGVKSEHHPSHII
jgi:hypothetical protein